MNRQRLTMIGAIAVEAMLYEVSATPKPGLVDRANSGAHHDMDFFTFMSSAAALRGYFDECAAIGAGHCQQPIEGLLPCLQAAGIVAERQMFTLTQGVNTHKGMIFSLGILAGAAGWAAAGRKGLTAEYLGSLAAQMCAGLCESAYSGLTERPQEQLTKGEAMYLRYGVTGVRGEAQSAPHANPAMVGQGAGYDAKVSLLWKLWARLYARPATYRAFTWLATRFRFLTPKQQSGWTAARTPLKPAPRRLRDMVKDRR